MNYYLVKDKKGNPTALMSAVDKMPMVPLHEPKTISYFEDKSVVTISKEKFDQFHGDMIYPTEGQIKEASREQLCAWWRFLPSPGSSAVGTPEFSSKLESECKTLDHIAHHLNACGGFTPQISKKIGWT